MCPMANRDDAVCNYAICNVCEEKHKSNRRAKKQRTNKCGNQCRHQFCYLNMIEKPFWVGRNYIDGTYCKKNERMCLLQ